MKITSFDRQLFPLVGQVWWVDIKILGQVNICPFVCMSVCLFKVGPYQKFPTRKNYVYTE